MEKDANGQKSSRRGGNAESQGRTECCWKELRHEWKRFGEHTLLERPISFFDRRSNSSNTIQNGSRTKMTKRKTGIWINIGNRKRRRILKLKICGLLNSVFKKDTKTVFERSRYISHGQYIKWVNVFYILFPTHGYRPKNSCRYDYSSSSLP
jgi:hypothetical protein